MLTENPLVSVHETCSAVPSFHSITAPVCAEWITGSNSLTLGVVTIHSNFCICTCIDKISLKISITHTYQYEMPVTVRIIEITFSLVVWSWWGNIIPWLRHVHMAVPKIGPHCWCTLHSCLFQLQHSKLRVIQKNGMECQQWSEWSWIMIELH